jgi:hypothetical protein
MDGHTMAVSHFSGPSTNSKYDVYRDMDIFSDHMWYVMVGTGVCRGLS